MMRVPGRNVCGILFVLAMLAGSIPTTLLAAEKAAKEPAEAKKATGRLPLFYREVVTPEQRDKVYQIQAEYQPKLAALSKQVAALTKEQNEKIDALLTPEQLQKVAQLKAAAAAKRAASQPAEPAKAKPAKPASGQK